VNEHLAAVKGVTSTTTRIIMKNIKSGKRFCKNINRKKEAYFYD